MKVWSRISIKTFLLATAIGLAGWYGYNALTARPSKHPQKLYQEKITIGTVTWPGYLPLYVAQDKGYFKEAGLDVEVKLYVSLGELSKDYLSGKMQGRANLTLDAIHERLQGLDHKIILAIDHSDGADAIIGRTDVKSMADCKGKRAAFEPGTLEEFFLSWALRENGLSLADIVPVRADPKQAVKLLESGKADIAVSHEPFLSRVAASKNIRLIFSSADAPGLISDVLTFRTDFISAYPETVRSIVKAYFKGLKFLESNPYEAHAIVARYFNDDPDDISRALTQIAMLDERDNRAAFTFATGLESIYGNLRRTADFVSEQKGMKVLNFDTNEMVEGKFVKNSKFKMTERRAPTP